LNDETARYIFRILAFKEIFENKEKYGFRLKKEHLYKPVKLTYVEINESIPNLVEFALKHNLTYKLLKIHNPWLRKNSLTVENGKKYRIAIPIGEVEEDDVTARELAIDELPVASLVEEVNETSCYEKENIPATDEAVVEATVVSSSTDAEEEIATEELVFYDADEDLARVGITENELESPEEDILLEEDIATLTTDDATVEDATGVMNF
ncbi:MAG: hypothetical protein NZ521_05955, partial [Flammeovirgaceae bacterium]|nr:hypothetical protein [Flammeovirgaceae bacterium]MDW8287777.1 hypothetical protein [Flammeovirgaceae bacterium]